MRHLICLTLFALLTLLTYGAEPAHACPDGPRAVEIDALGSVRTDFHRCRLVDSFSIPSGSGEIPVRVFATADPRGENLNFIRDAFHHAGSTLARLGPYTTQPIEVYLSPAESTEPDTAGMAAGSIGDGEVALETCMIALFVPMNFDYLANTVAHEFFHCVQYHHTLMPNNASIHDGATDQWWVEGGAEWFASHASPDDWLFYGNVADFDANSHKKPIHGMSYEAVVFWWWYNQDRGDRQTIDSILAMPLSAGDQATAFAGEVGQEGFHEFGRAYLSNRIQMPSGGMAPTAPIYEEERFIDSTKEEEFEAERNLLYRAKLHYSCGAWTQTQENLVGKLSVAKPTERFGPLPDRVQSNGDDPEMYFMLGTSVSEEGFKAKIKAEKEACAPCRQPDPDGPEACLFGRWELVAGGYGARVAELLNNTELTAVTYPEPERYLTFQPDGRVTASSAGETGHAESPTNDGNIIADFNLTLTKNGYWNVDGDKLHICYAPGGEFNLSGTIIEPTGEEGSFNHGAYLGPAIEQRSVRLFACEGNQMEMVEGAEAGALAISSTYNK